MRTWYRKYNDYIQCQLCNKRLDLIYQTKKECPVCKFSDKQVSRGREEDSINRVRGRR